MWQLKQVFFQPHEIIVCTSLLSNEYKELNMFKDLWVVMEFESWNIYSMWVLKG